MTLKIRLHIWDHQPTQFLIDQHHLPHISISTILCHSTANHQSVNAVTELSALDWMIHFTTAVSYESLLTLLPVYHHFVFLMLEWDCNSLCHSFLWTHPVSVSHPHIGCSLPRGALHTKQDLSPAASTARAPITPRVAQNRETFRDLDKTMTALKVLIYQHCLCLWFAYYRLFLRVWNLVWYFNFDTFHCFGCGTGLWPIQSSW